MNCGTTRSSSRSPPIWFGAPATRVHWPCCRRAGLSGRRPRVHGRIIHGSKTSRRGGGDHRFDGQHAEEIPLVECRGVARCRRRCGHVIEAAAAEGTAKGEGRLFGVARYTAAVLFNGLGRYKEAFEAARECCEYEDLGFYSWCLFELIEAAAMSATRTPPRRRYSCTTQERAPAEPNGDWVQWRARGLGSPQRTRRRLVHRGHRTSRACQHGAVSRAYPVGLRRMAAPGESPTRRPRAARHRPGDVHPNGRRGFRGTGPPGNDRHRGEGAHSSSPLATS